jgi:ATP-binding cassette subfamily B (MDR/TAP) protein 1
MRMDQRAQDRCQAYFLESSRFASEAVGAIRTVTSLRLENEVIRRYADRLTAAVSRSAKGSLLYFVVFALSDSVDLLGNIFPSALFVCRFLQIAPDKDWQ